MVNLTDHHHVFLQAMLLRRAAPVENWKNVWKKSAQVLQVRVQEDEFEQFWRLINEKIEPLGFRIGKMTDHGIGPLDQRDQGACGGGGSIDSRTPGRAWMALTNTRSDDSAKLGTEFNPNEISLFKKLVDRIILAPNRRFCIQNHDAIRCSNKITNLKKSDTQHLLSVLVKKGWLSRSRAGFYSLSIRSQLELRSYIAENFNPEDQPPTCTVCKDMVMRGYKCINEECSRALHEICEIRWRKKNEICSECKTLLSRDQPIGEDAPRGEYPPSEEEESPPSKKKQRKRLEDLDELSDEGQSQPNPSPSISRRKSSRTNRSSQPSRLPIVPESDHNE